MKMTYHQIPPSSEESFNVLELRGPHYHCTWHFHPEYQLGIVLKGAGHRIVGDSIAPLEVGDVSLLGPNLPHAWQFESATRPGQELHAIVVYFKENSLGAEFFARPEAQRILRLLKHSSVGLQVLGRTRRVVTPLLESIPRAEGFQRVITLLQILHCLAKSEEVVPICSPGFMPKGPDRDGERLRKICELIQERLAEPLHRDEVAKQAHFSPAAFSRFFKKRTGKTFHDFVAELRVGRACRLLSEQELNVTEIAYACGFSNIASFNRSFRRAKQAAPTEYRKKLLAMN
ncbi:MAG: AraC family transcriptional regulator [Opitutaceae bacterium]|nr:AraC family transcriptional regulator [Opitutaceae bacterium]